MRLSEVLALEWDDIDFREKRIQVYRSSHFGIKEPGEDSAHHINSTKEGKPKCYIDISDEDVEFLKKYKIEQQKRRLQYRRTYHDNNLVFARKNGLYIHNSTVTKNFTNFAHTNGFNISFHGLRHTHITLLLAEGVPVTDVAIRVGHQRPSTTSDIYWHAEQAGKSKQNNLGDLFVDIMRSKKQYSDEELIKAEKIAREIN